MQFAERRRTEVLENPSTESEHSEANPNNNHAPDNRCKWDGNSTVRVSNEVRIQLPPDFLAQYKSDQDKSAAHNNKMRLVSWLTLGAVVIYAFLTALQAYESRKAVQASQDANSLLEESTRAQLSIETKMRPIRAGSPILMDVTITNVGHTFANVATNFSSCKCIRLGDNEMPSKPGEFNTILEPGKPMYTAVEYPYPVSQSLLDNLPSTANIQDLVTKSPRSETIYLYGRIDYQTLGRTRMIQFCFFLIRNEDQSLLPPNSGIQNDEYVPLQCSRWNSHE